MAENLLILTPVDYTTVPNDPPALVETLHEDGFIADTLELDGEEHFRPGEEFLTQITFLGCSPVISMGEPGKTGDEFCHIQFVGPLDRPQFIAGDNVKIPRCPGCGYRFEAWPEMSERWEASPDSGGFSCPECGRDLSLPQLRWRKCAGFGRFFIKIWGIFESEAVPNPNLLSTLEKVSGTSWQHFYIRLN